MGETQFSGQFQSSLEPYSIAFSLLPQVIWLGRTISERYEDLPEIGTLVREAAAAAVTAGEYTMAVEWLEQGRSIIWSQLLGLRTPIETLRNIDPGLAKKILEVSSALENAGSRDTQERNLTGTDSQSSPEKAAQYHHRLAEEWERLLGQVRALPGFEDFLLPKRFSQLCKASNAGPVVVFNIHQSRCDALVIMEGLDDAIHVPLSRFSYAQAENLQKNFAALLSKSGARSREARGGKPYRPSKSSFCDAMKDIWSTAIEPVFEALAITVSIT
jgi:hypothetical protein